MNRCAHLVLDVVGQPEHAILGAGGLSDGSSSLGPDAQPGALRAGCLEPCACNPLGFQLSAFAASGHPQLMLEIQGVTDSPAGIAQQTIVLALGPRLARCLLDAMLLPPALAADSVILLARRSLFTLTLPALHLEGHLCYAAGRLGSSKDAECGGRWPMEPCAHVPTSVRMAPAPGPTAGNGAEVWCW